MSVVFITSTDAQLDFSFGRTSRSIERRVSSADAMFCLSSPTIIAIVGIYGVEAIDTSAKISDTRLGIFFGDIQE